MQKVSRNGNIELLRFCFCILIVLHHFSSDVFNGAYFTAGYLGVEFFFMVTGIFLGKKLKKDKELHRTESFGIAAKEGLGYVRKRICGIYPYFFVATLIGFVVRIFLGINTIRDFPSLGGDFLFLQNLGFDNLSCIGTLWYLSALFAALLFLYPFARRYYDAFTHFFAVLFPVFYIGIIVKNFSDLGIITNNIYGIFNIGILRAVAMISVGFLINEAAEKIKSLPDTKKNRILFTVGEVLLYLLCFTYIVFASRCKNDYLCLLVMIAALILTLSEKSLLFGKLNNKLFMFLGKSSMIIFMCHYFWVNNISSFSKHLPSAVPQGKATDIVLGFALTFVTSVIVYFSGKLLRFLFRKVSNCIMTEPKATEQA